MLDEFGALHFKKLAQISATYVDIPVRFPCDTTWNEASNVEHQPQKDFPINALWWFCTTFSPQLTTSKLEESDTSIYGKHHPVTILEIDKIMLGLYTFWVNMFNLLNYNISLA